MWNKSGKIRGIQVESDGGPLRVSSTSCLVQPRLDSSSSYCKSQSKHEEAVSQTIEREPVLPPRGYLTGTVCYLLDLSLLVRLALLTIRSPTHLCGDGWMRRRGAATRTRSREGEGGGEGEGRLIVGLSVDLTWPSTSLH